MPRLSISTRASVKAALGLQRLALDGAELLAQDLQACAKEECARIASAQGSLMREWRELEQVKRLLLAKGKRKNMPVNAPEAAEPNERERLVAHPLSVRTER